MMEIFLSLNQKSWKEYRGSYGITYEGGEFDGENIKLRFRYEWDKEWGKRHAKGKVDKDYQGLNIMGIDTKFYEKLFKGR